jgi:hypothetical protein
MERNDIAWERSRVALNRTTLYLLNRPGPTVFTVSNVANTHYKVTLGSPHKCSCRGRMCVHLLYVLLKVIGLPEDNPYCRKTHLSDYEIDQILNTNFSTLRRPRPIPPRQVVSKTTHSEPTNKENAPSSVERHRFDGSVQMCPICQDDMCMEQALTWCRQGCGNNIHANCKCIYSQT